MDLLLTVRSPLRLILGEEVVQPALIIDGNEVHESVAPWSVNADILFNRATREFVGVSYLADKNEDLIAKAVYDALDPEVARFIESPGSRNVAPYEGVPSRFNAFEIRWSESDVTDLACAQLADAWYFRTGRLQEPQHMIAYGKAKIDDILRSFDLRLPTKFSAGIELISNFVEQSGIIVAGSHGIGG